MKKDHIIVVFSSHYSKEENEKFSRDIVNTIGCEHKVVCYENHNQFSLTEVYNDAIKNHNNENGIMVFCHNDIKFLTKNWGRILLTKFNSTNYSIIGVAGSTYLPESGVWWEDKSKMVGIVEHTDGYDTWVSQYSEEKKGQITPVVLIDGLFMAVDANDIEHLFDEEFKGFHMYDLSFCIPNWLDGIDVGVTTDIRILHKSVGQTNQQWEVNRKLFVEKYKDELPITIYPHFNKLNINLTTKPKVSVIIPTKNNLKYIRNNINSWNDVVKYDNFEIIIADTGSSDDVIKAYDEFLNKKIKLVRYDYYNFGKINNDIVKNYISDDTELILFCNDDILLLNDALSRCVEIYNENKEDVGTIGIRLHYGDASIQHNGINIIKNTNNIGFTHVDIKKMDNYFQGVNYESIGNTGAFLLINKELFSNINYFNENYIECFEDVELNMKCLINDKKNITISDAVAFHYESISRDKDKNKIKNLNKDYIERLYPFYIKNKIKLDKYIKIFN